MTLPGQRPKTETPALLAANEGESLFNGVDFTGWKFRNPAGEKTWSVAEVALDPRQP